MTDREIELQSGTVGAGGFPGDTSRTGSLRPPTGAGESASGIDDADDETDGTGTIRGGIPGGGSGSGGGPGTIAGVRNGSGDDRTSA